MARCRICQKRLHRPYDILIVHFEQQDETIPSSVSRRTKHAICKVCLTLSVDELLCAGLNENPIPGHSCRSHIIDTTRKKGKISIRTLVHMPDSTFHSFHVVNQE